jgi:diaminobutyrate-2-oxoglutarate transaminase
MSDKEFAQLSYDEAPRIVVKPPGPISRRLRERQDLLETAAVSYPKSLPIAIEEGKGATLRDVDGNVYLDFFGGAGVLNIGHCNPDVVSAARQQMGKLTHSLDFPTTVRMELEEELLFLLPNGFQKKVKIFFVAPTGSDAIEAAMKLAKYNTHRVGMISFEGGYHGMTAGAVTLTANKKFKKNFMPMIPEVHFVPYAYCYRCAFGREYSDCGVKCAEYLEHVLDDPESGIVDPAAIVLEAVQGEGGSIPAPDEFVKEVRRISKEHSIPLIDDEIQAGIARTGKMWACEHSGITPDIMTISKGIGGGLPLSIVVFDKRLDTWEKAAHVGTFRGHVVAMAAGVATLKFIKKNKLWDHADRLGRETFLPRLNEIKNQNKYIGDVRGKGLMIGIEFVKDKRSRKPWPEMVRQVQKSCYEKGLITEVGGHYSNVIRFLPPLVITRQIAETAIDIFADATKEAETKI